MKQTSFLLILVAVGLILGSGVAIAQKKAKPTYVVVDPMELRQPVPDPELGLTEKYDGKTVRFTGVVTCSTVDKKTKQTRYEVQHQILQPEAVKTKGARPKVAVNETIVVSVTFEGEEKELQKDLAKSVQARKPGPVVTVQGKGAVMTDEKLVITEGTIVPAR